MTPEHEEAVRLAEKHGASVGGHPAYEQPLYIVAAPSELAALIADVRWQAMGAVEGAVPDEPPELKGRFQAELFWRGAYLMRDAIRARLEVGK